jgi:hypothetical protein
VLPGGEVVVRGLLEAGFEFSRLASVEVVTAGVVVEPAFNVLLGAYAEGGELADLHKFADVRHLEERVRPEDIFVLGLVNDRLKALAKGYDALHVLVTVAALQGLGRPSILIGWTTAVVRGVHRDARRSGALVVPGQPLASPRSSPSGGALAPVIASTQSARSPTTIRH